MAWSDDVKAFIEALKFAPIGLKGVILYGSRARGSAGVSSDTDLLIIVNDRQDPMTIRRAIHETIISRRLVTDQISWNVSTVSKLKYALTSGDPFALSMCFDGVIVHQEGQILSDILTDIHRLTKIYNPEEVFFVVRKNHEHLKFCILSTFVELLSYAQQLTITGAQLSLLHQTKTYLTVKDLLDLATWNTLRRELEKHGATQSALASMDELVQGFKTKSTEKAFSELCQGLNEHLFNASWNSG